MPYQMQFSTLGAPDVLERREVHVPAPGPGEVLIRQDVVGLNFVDVYHRTGVYPLALPAAPGVEGAGVIEALGPDVTGLTVGQRVAYAGVVGAYADQRILPAWRAIPLPDDLSAEMAGSSLLRGMTSYMLLQKLYPVSAGMQLLVHTGAGGLGSVVTRWAKLLGAEVIATVSSDEKAELARAHGADHVIVGRGVDPVRSVEELTDGKGVHLAIDGIGGAMLAKSIACVRPFGMTASVGQVGGVAPPVPLSALRSNALARPSVMAFSTDREAYRPAVEAVFAVMRRGILDRPSRRYALGEAAAAHADIEAGRLVGSALLVP
ncbi:quinone oxidoreductase family protein [Affinirhizobium pseudoryzae]|jgi:NADPH2:quinone reductase|uniref:quinone oxidoreductase family protein n=1 Tax=Allorhizobium pseudoryzae TaxID=379684 RepID=UPI001F352C99|nr:quinone oxidoreductase [Allorhizobium pseudoryzae]